MGNLVSSTTEQFSTSSSAPPRPPHSRPLRILVCGPKGSGKTSLLTQLKKANQGSSEIEHQTPTIGVETETLTLGNDEVILTTINREYMWTRWDNTEEVAFRKKLYQDADAIAYVVDSNSETMLPNYNANDTDSQKTKKKPFLFIKGARGSWEAARFQLHRLLLDYGENDASIKFSGHM